MSPKPTLYSVCEQHSMERTVLRIWIPVPYPPAILKLRYFDQVSKMSLVKPGLYYIYSIEWTRLKDSSGSFQLYELYLHLCCN